MSVTLGRIPPARKRSSDAPVSHSRGFSLVSLVFLWFGFPLHKAAANKLRDSRHGRYDGSMATYHSSAPESLGGEKEGGGTCPPLTGGAQGNGGRDSSFFPPGSIIANMSMFVRLQLEFGG